MNNCEIINKEDADFYDRAYEIYLNPHCGFIVYADYCEVAAPGLIMDQGALDDRIDPKSVGKEYPEYMDVVTAGNHGVYLDTVYMNIREIGN